jgi:hypothetical protein
VKPMAAKTESASLRPTLGRRASLLVSRRAGLISSIMCKAAISDGRFGMRSMILGILLLTADVAHAEPGTVFIKSTR